ncbi:Glycerol-3-phosphate 2-O-acyltransferase 6 [Canna indica]|uniref:Glycerol-3-phosphate 2-O-acyltransferase 6 n=1 Tax=Canna indica TaxID=4628 RepID=A0AAQ3QL83_9LILI|nr:Glycerol-3-phosphate 2-O-acyltransferase 6 [Canna indica]
MNMFRIKEAYIVPPKPQREAVTTDKLPKPIVFHDSCLVLKPTPLLALLILLWLPPRLQRPLRLLPSHSPRPCLPLRRPIATVTYSIPRVSDFLSPIKTVAVSRNRPRNAAMIKRLLADSDLAICPEGTTCRESFLLRFSALFAELREEIVPVAMVNRMSVFHGMTSSGSDQSRQAAATASSPVEAL